MSIIDLQAQGTNIVKTASQWANNTDIYTDAFILYVSDEFYNSTNQMKFKKANGVNTFSELDFMPLGETTIINNTTNQTTGGTAVLSPMDKLKKIITESAFNKRKLNYIIVGDSLRGRNNRTDLIDYARGILHQVNIYDVVLNAVSTLNSTEWVNGTKSATMAQCVDSCIGVDGEDSIVEFSFGFNDVSISTYTPALFASGKADYKANIQTFINAVPNVNILLVSPNATTIPEYDALMIQMIREIAEELELPYVDMVRGFENIRPATTQSNKDSSYYDDSIHVNDNGGRRIYNCIMNAIIPDGLRFKVNMFEFDNVEPAQPYNASPIILNSGWRNDFASGELRLNNVSTWRCFSKVNVYENQLYKLKMNTAVVGTVAEIRWVYPNQVMEKEILRSLPEWGDSNRDFWEIIVPKGSISMHITLSLNGAEFDSSGDVPELYLHYTKNDYVMSLEDINRPLKMFLNS